MSDVEILGKCPLCEGNVIEKRASFGCSEADWKNEGTEDEPKWINEGCGYSIYKIGYMKFGGREINPEDVKTLLKDGHFNMSMTRDVKIVVDEKFGTKMDYSK